MYLFFFCLIILQNFITIFYLIRNYSFLNNIILIDINVIDIVKDWFSKHSFTLFCLNNIVPFYKLNKLRKVYTKAIIN